ncbi:unnamed protein product [Rotaria socialis]|uniref:lysophospholipase n=1 Tax=Rotaria socialis TaxID=392032 RepID=A0A818CS64_9BILA|nr:unnamed protein product [Rotaria socialis]
MDSIGIRNDFGRARGNRAILDDRRSRDKSNIPALIPHAPYTSTGSSSIYHRRARPLPSIPTTNVATLRNAIETGHMNVSVGNNNRMRSPSRHSQTLLERTTRNNNSIKNNVVNNSTVQDVPTKTVTVYTIASVPQSKNNDVEESDVLEGSINVKSTNPTIPSVNEPSLKNGGLCGLQNLGNTCFMNSVLQCLSNTKPLLLFCLKDNLNDHLNKSSTSVMKGALMTEYANLIRKMWLLPVEGRSVVSPSRFKSTIGNFASRFTGYSEQDSQEFLRYLLQGLSEDVNRVQKKPVPLIIDEKQDELKKEKDRATTSWDRCLRYENSPLVDIFAGQLKSTLECCHCGYQSITFDMFWDLSLPLPRDRSSTNLQDCIQLFMSKEELDGDEEPMCNRCKKKRPCTKKLSIQKCPEILVLHLKRFSQMRGRTKLNTHVDFPITNLRLDHLKDVMSSSYEECVPTYNLFGISNHSGTVYSGHYVAQCKHPFTHDWHEFNDSSVHFISDTSNFNLKKMKIPSFISDSVNITYQYLITRDGFLSQIFGEHLENTIVGFCLLIVVFLLYYLIRRSQAKVRSNENTNRFRKRDKVLHYGKRFLRTVRSYSSTARNRIRRKNKRQSHQQKPGSESNYRLPRKPPEFLLDTDGDTTNTSNQYHIPSEILYLLKSVKVFGHFERPIFLELCKSLESKLVLAGAYLFRIGDADDSLYVVQKGLLHVFITDERHHRHLIKECVEGDTVFSLLSMVDVMTRQSKPFKTVSCKAIEDSVVLKLPAEAFLNVFKEYPECMVRIIQISMIRLQRVTFLALHNYLGLTTELTHSIYINPQFQPTQDNHSHKLNNQRRHSHSNVSVHGADISKDALNNIEEDLIDNENIQSSTSVTIASCNSPSSYETQTTPISAMNDNKNEFETMEVPSSTEPTVSMAVPTQTRAANFCNQRSMSVIESRHMKPDFEEAAARARVKNSLDTTFFEKHKISYPNVSNNRATNSSTARRRGSFSDPDNANIYSRSLGSGSDSGGSEYNEGIDDSDLQVDWPQIRNALAKALGFEGDLAFLDDKVHLHRLPDRYTLVKEGEQLNKLFFVIHGSISAYMKEISDPKKERVMFTNQANEISGLVSVLTGEPTLFSYRTHGLTDICTITKENFYELMRVQPNLVLPIAAMMVQRMSPLVRQIDFALEWMLVEAGKALYRQDYKPQNVYIVLNGRVRSVLLAQDKKRRELIGEHGRGEMVGLIEVLMEMPRQSTTIAVRDTELAVIPSGLLNYIKWRHPRVVSHLIHVLSQKIYGTMQNTLTNSVGLAMPLTDDEFQDQATVINKNLSTVAIVAASDDVPLDAFTCELVHSLIAIGPTLHLTQQLIIDRFGVSAFESINDYRLSAWLGQQEELHRIVVYQCDKQLTPWTKRSLRQADCILIVGIGWKEAVKGSVEKEIERIAVRAQKELILLHRMGSLKPKGTAEWLKERNWCTFHHHVRCPQRVFQNINLGCLNDYTDLLEPDPDPTTDFARMARFLTGTAIGLVLGGGGARGIAHVGMIQAMHEAGIPIDLIGGTSIGAFMGALWADELNVNGYVDRATHWCKKMTSFWRKLLDLTYPITSMFTGAAFNEIIEEALLDVQIEDLWIPYFCITTDISASKMRVHTTGSLWRYVRASMSLSGYFPPLCDPNDGHLLLDGGYVNNLPADVMYKLGAHTVLAVDVGAQDEQNFYNFGDQLSGWWLLYKRWNIWSTPVKVPELSEIQTRLAYVSCQRQLEIVKNSNYCEYLRPPIDRYRTLQFGSFDEIREVGYHHGKAVFHGWSKLESYDAVFLKHKLHSSREKQLRLRKQESAGTKFIDLAELITRVRDAPKDDYDDDDDMDGDDADEIETTNTEDSHTSISSYTRLRPRRIPRSTRGWLTTVGGGLKRYRRRVRLRSRPETPPILIQGESRNLLNVTNPNDDN